MVCEESLGGKMIPHLANGLFLPNRRIEDKLDSLQLALKVIQVLFDVTATHGNRNPV